MVSDVLGKIIGERYGRLQIYGEKTLEGFAIFLLTCFIGSYYLVSINFSQMALLSYVAAVVELFWDGNSHLLAILAYYGTRLVYVYL